MCNVKIRGMCINKGTTQNYKIWYGRKEVGSLKLQTMWTPKQLQQVRFNQAEISQNCKYAQNAVNYFQTQIEITQNNLSQIKQDVRAMRMNRINTNMAIQEATNATIATPKSGNLQELH